MDRSNSKTNQHELTMIDDNNHDLELQDTLDRVQEMLDTARANPELIGNIVLVLSHEAADGSGVYLKGACFGNPTEVIDHTTTIISNYLDQVKEANGDPVSKN